MLNKFFINRENMKNIFNILTCDFSKKTFKFRKISWITSTLKNFISFFLSILS